MNTSSINLDQESVYRERLQQAKRVMKGLLDAGHANRFNINVFAAQSGDYIVGCIAGHCGLDPWFQEQGLVTHVVSGYYDTVGEVSISPGDFFGTEVPFYASYYGVDQPVTVEDALRALDRALSYFSAGSGDVDP